MNLIEARLMFLLDSMVFCPVTVEKNVCLMFICLPNFKYYTSLGFYMVLPSI